MAAAKEPTGYERITARVDPPAHRALLALSARHGVTISGLIEALGRRVEKLEWHAFFEELVDDARHVDAERKGRRRSN